MAYDLEWLKANATFSCQNSSCREEVSFEAHMLALWNGEPICEECYLETEGSPRWNDLPPFNPFEFITREVN